jgi:hypothetical protein
VTIVERVSHLEGIDGISSEALDLFTDLLRGQSVLVKSIIEFNFVNEMHF